MKSLEDLTGTCPVVSTGATTSTLASALNILAAAQCLITEDWPEDACVQNSERFDFIIVGAGSAGSVVANRLSEINKWKILLIEAGGDPPDESIIPSMTTALMRTQYDWNYTTTNDGRSSQGLLNESVVWPRGRMLGGSSSMNAMVYLKGSSHDYQEWYDEGNKEWHPDIVKEYNKKAESLQNKKMLANPNISKNYGKTGPLVINTFNNTLRPVMEKIIDSWDELGFKRVPDLNSADLRGSSIYTASAANGQRKSTAVAYLNSIKRRKNLKVIKKTLVTKILIDDKNVAYGVEVDRDGETLTFYASKEVILSAGAINTPQLLMLSGIGNETTLNSFEIPCVVNLPGVGKNLQDHIWVTVPIFGDEPEELNELEDAFDTVRYLYDRKGKLAESPIAEGTALFSLNGTVNYAQFQTFLFILRKNTSALDVVVGNFKDSLKKSITGYSDYASYIFIFNLLKPRSRGYVTLKSSNPYDPPLMYSGYLQDPEDLKLTAAGIKMLTKIVDTRYFRSINAFLGRYDWEPCNEYELDSTDYWECIALDISITLYHQVGTAKMGKDPETAVVDSRLRVHGVKGLRVVDASVMPTVTACNTNGPTIMIGERASDLIKEDYKVIGNK